MSNLSLIFYWANYSNFYKGLLNLIISKNCIAKHNIKIYFKEMLFFFHTYL